VSDKMRDQHMGWGWGIHLQQFAGRSEEREAPATRRRAQGRSAAAEARGAVGEAKWAAWSVEEGKAEVGRRVRLSGLGKAHMQ
jgi:hypothetical protein